MADFSKQAYANGVAAALEKFGAEAPWEKNAPPSGEKKTLSSDKKNAAKRRAAAAGRPYPNLVDNMWAAKKADEDLGAVPQKTGAEDALILLGLPYAWAEKLGGAAWQRAEGKNPEGGLNEKGRASLRAQGHDIKRPVSSDEAKKSPRAAARRKSFCARMSGMPGPMKKDNGEPTRKALALRKWDC